MPPLAAAPAELLVQFRIGTATVADVTVASVGDDGDALLSISLGDDGSNVVRLVGTCWTMHRLVIELDRRLTQLARQSSLSASDRGP